MLIAVALPILLAAAACSGSDDSSSSSATTSPPSTQAPASTSASTSATTPATTTESGPPCTADAISQAITASGAQVTAVDDFKCGGGWAGANYDNPMFTVATLLQAQGAQWVVVDRAQYCDNPAIPADVHYYCTVS